MISSVTPTLISLDIYLHVVSYVPFKAPRLVPIFVTRRSPYSDSQFAHYTGQEYPASFLDLIILNSRCSFVVAVSFAAFASLVKCWLTKPLKELSFLYY